MGRKKKSRYITSPITGITYERGSLMDFGKYDNYNPPRRKRHSRNNESGYGYNQRNLWDLGTSGGYTRPRYKRNYGGGRRQDLTIRDLSPKEMIILVCIVFAVLFYIFVVPAITNFMKTHVFLSSLFGTLIVGGLILGGVFYIKFKIQKKREEELFEREQVEKGLIKFVDRFNNVRWGKPNEVGEWTKEDNEAREQERSINRVTSEIKNFSPARKYGNEFPYQVELVGYLKNKFPEADIEQQRGSSRPDIVIGDVAIEVKGPTRTGDLQTIADKCMRYAQHFGEIIIVLFEVEVYEPRYEEWVRGIKHTFPKVEIIRR